MDVWQGLVGQTEIISQLRRLAEANAARYRKPDPSADDASADSPSADDASPVLAQPTAGDETRVMPEADPDSDIRLAHSWLFTGPAGSGRSNLALAFAASLLCPDGGCGSCQSCLMARSGNHPDLRVLRTEKVIIEIDDVRDIVAASYLSPSISRLRIQVIEDADRMSERTSNVLLKAIEEPPSSTIWILCSPSEADMLPTIRSRVRTVRLSTPTVEQVADFIVTADGVDPALAMRSAREAQSHIGMARRLATDADSRARRDASVLVLLGIVSSSHVAKGAQDLVAIAEQDTQAAATLRTERDRSEFFRQLGLPLDAPVPAQYRAQVKAFDESNKRLIKRSLLDGVDRILLDLESVGRDALLVRMGVNDGLINVERAPEITAWAAKRTPAQLVGYLDAIAEARTRTTRNVTPLLAFEAMLAAVIDKEAVS